VTYDGIWSDYFGTWAWHSGQRNGTFRTVAATPSPGTRRSLLLQSVLGIIPTLVALAGWMLLARGALRRRETVALAALPVLGTIGYLYYAVTYWIPDGDLLKATYMLSTAPAWAVGFGYALDRLRGWLWLTILSFLTLSALAELPFLIYE
jgi:hypothetical protein